MSSVSGKTPLAIPVSAYVPVALERPLKLFGKTFEVRISSALTLSPDTVLRVTWDSSLLQLMRNDKARLDQHIRAMWRGVTGRNRLSLTTRKRLGQMLGSFLPPDALDDVLRGKEPSIPPPSLSDWELVEKGLGDPGEDDLYQLVARLARLDRLASSARQVANGEHGSPDAAMKLIAASIGDPRDSWRVLNPMLSMRVAFLLDVCLQTLAWIEWRHAPETRSTSTSGSSPLFSALLAPGRKPLGHWLRRIIKLTACSDLKDLSALMASKGIEWHGYYISHDLLKKWSSGQQLMPRLASKEVLSVISSVDAERELRWFSVARLTTFLCDLVVAATCGEAPSWATAQDQIARRYMELYQSEGLRRRA